MMAVADMSREVLEAIRGALGLEDPENDTSMDERIERMRPRRRSELVFQWNLGSGEWHYEAVRWLRQCGFEVTEKEE